MNIDQNEIVCISGDLICFAQQAVWMALIVRDDDNKVVDDYADAAKVFHICAYYIDWNPKRMIFR